MRAQQTDFFMVCNMATKKSGIPDQPVEKIRFEIFKTLSCLHFLAKFNEFLIFCSSCRAVQKILLAFSRTGSSGSAKSVSVFSSYSRLQYRSVVHPYQHFLLLIGVKKFPFGFLNFFITLQKMPGSLKANGRSIFLSHFPANIDKIKSDDGPWEDL